MSRSYKKVGTHKINAGSMKWWKRRVNRGLRSRAKQLINTCKDFDLLVIPVPNEISTVWDSAKDYWPVYFSAFKYYSQWRDEWYPGIEEFRKLKRK